jgi:hypothetical protein
MSIYSFNGDMCLALTPQLADFNISTKDTDNFINSLAIIVITVYNNTQNVNAKIRINGKQQQLEIISTTNEIIKLNLNDNTIYYGNFGEIIHYYSNDQALTTEQIIIEEKYLAKKWGISLNS